MIDLKSNASLSPGESPVGKNTSAGAGQNKRELDRKRGTHFYENKGAPLYRDQALAKTLTNMGVSVEIPPRLYNAAAEILTFVAELDKKA